MKTNYVVAAVVLVIVAILAASAYTIFKNQATDGEIIEVSPLPRPISEETFGGTPTPEPQSTTATQPKTQPQSGTGDNLNEDFIVIKPANGEHLTFPFAVSGYSQKNETIAINIIDLTGNLLASQSTACKGEEICSFYSFFDIQKPDASTGTVEIKTDSFTKLIPVVFN